MQLRPRQKTFVDACTSALKEHDNTLAIACTGFGKSISLSAIAGQYDRALILQHRTELLDQNKAKYKRANPGKNTATFAADMKRWIHDDSDGATFAMVQTLIGNLTRMKPVDLVVIDEAHHIAAKSYLDIIAYALDANPKCHILGLTATPERADGKGLREVFTNVADVVSLAEMVQSGFLVRPRTFVIDLGLSPGTTQELKRTSRDFDMDAAAAILDIEPITDRVIGEWKRLAGDRRTIGFATNVAHSQHMAEAFCAVGITAEHIDGTTPDGERKAILRRLDCGETQVVWNCNVLTEGFDSPSVSCVILHRPSLHRSTMVQMVGRGLRTISEPERYPGIVKSDCIVIDTGSSLMTHATLESEVSIDGREKGTGEAPTKECGECGSIIPMGCMVCPICGHEFESRQKDRIATGDFTLTEIELIKLSPYRWETLWEDAVVMANALTAWAALIHFQGIWFAYGGVQGQRPVRMLASSHDKIIAMVRADDFLRENGDKDAARKSKRWIDEPATDKQYEMLGEAKPLFGAINRYRAACLITWRWNESKIRESIFAIGKQIACT